MVRNIRIIRIHDTITGLLPPAEPPPYSPLIPHTSSHLSLRSAGPSPNRVMGSPRARRQAFTSESSVDTLICRARFLRSNSARTSACRSLMCSSRSNDSPEEEAAHLTSRSWLFLQSGWERLLCSSRSYWFMNRMREPQWRLTLDRMRLQVPSLGGFIPNASVPAPITTSVIPPNTSRLWGARMSRTQ